MTFAEPRVVFPQPVEHTGIFALQMHTADRLSKEGQKCSHMMLTLTLPHMPSLPQGIR